MSINEGVGEFLRSGKAFLFIYSKGVSKLIKLDDEEALDIRGVSIDDWIDYLDQHEEYGPYDMVFVGPEEDEKVIGVIGRPEDPLKALEIMMRKLEESRIEIGEARVRSMLNIPIMEVAPPITSALFSPLIENPSLPITRIEFPVIFRVEISVKQEALNNIIKNASSVGYEVKKENSKIILSKENKEDELTIILDPKDKRMCIIYVYHFYSKIFKTIMTELKLLEVL